MAPVATLWPHEPFWYLGRSSGFIAYGVLTGSMLLGLSISSRMFDGVAPRGWFYELHKFSSLLVVLVSLLHVLAFIPDDHYGLSVGDLFIPLHAATNPGPKVVAITTLYAMAALTGSFYITRWIGQKTWRMLHYLSFAVMVGATVHALWAGFDGQATVVRLTYFGVGAAIVFFIFYRMLALRGVAKPAAKAPQTRAA